MRDYFVSLRCFAAGAVRRWYVLAPALLLDPIDIYGWVKPESWPAYEPPVWVFWVLLLCAAFLAYHDLRTAPKNDDVFTCYPDHPDRMSLGHAAGCVATKLGADGEGELALGDLWDKALSGKLRIGGTWFEDGVSPRSRFRWIPRRILRNAKLHGIDRDALHLEGDRHYVQLVVSKRRIDQLYFRTSAT